MTRSVGIALPAVTGTYTATVTALDGAGNVAARSVELARVAAPIPLAAPSLTGTAQVGRTLTVSGGAFGNVPATVATAFLRVRGGVATLVRGAGPDRGYLVTRADVGATIVGRLVAANAAGTVTADTPASAAVLPASPSGGTPTIEGLPAVVDRPLTAAPGAWDNGGAPGRPAVTAIRWFACGAVCALVGRDARYVPGPDDVGRALLVEVDVANAAGTASGMSARTAVVVPGAPEFLAPPAVAGTARVGDMLTATTPATAAHGAAVTVAATWFACRTATVASCAAPVAGRGVAPDRRGGARPAAPGASARHQRRRQRRRVVGGDRAGARPQRVPAGGAREDHGLRRRELPGHGRGPARSPPGGWPAARRW